MKNLKLFVFALCLLTMSLVTVSAAETGNCEDAIYRANLGNGNYACGNSTAEVIENAEEGKTVEIEILKDFTMTADGTINRDIVYNLGGHTIAVTSGKKWTVAGANVTFKNGTIEVADTAFEVNSTSKATTLTIDAKVESTATNAVVTVSNATKAAVVNVNGTWEVKGELVGCTADGKETINLNANVTADLTTPAQLVSINAGTSVVNVLGGSYESNRLVFRLTNGTLNVKAGTIKSTGDNAILVNTADSDKKHALNINGGTITTEAENKYSVYFEYGTNAKNGTYSITDGTFTSGEDEKGNQLPALYINAQEFLDNHKSWIKGGKFTKAVVGDVKVGTKVYKTSAAATKIFVGNATVLNG